MAVKSGVSNRHACGRPSSGLHSHGFGSVCTVADRNDGRLNSSLARTTTNTHPSSRLHPPASPTWTPRKTPTAMLLSPRTRRKRQVVTLPCNATVPGRSLPRSGTGENCGIHPVPASATTIFNIQQRPTPCFGTILAFVSNHPRRVRLPLVTGARKHGKRQEKACLGEKFSRILACCLFGTEHPGRLGDASPGASALTAQRITRRQDLARRTPTRLSKRIHLTPRRSRVFQYPSKLG